MIGLFCKNYFQNVFVKPVVGVLKAFKIKPNTVTFLACFSGVATIFFIGQGYSYLGVVALLFSGYLDNLDGFLARDIGQVTAFGGALDSVSDRVVEFSVILGLFLVDPFSRGLLSLLMVGSSFICIISFLIIGVAFQGHSLKKTFCDVEFIGRTEAFIFFVAMIYKNKE